MISIDPRTNIVYASIYLLGLYRKYGVENVKFKSQPFKLLLHKNGIDDFHHYFAFYDHKAKKRYVVDFRDKNTFNLTALNWTDVYAKVNFNKNIADYLNLPDLQKNKIISIGPNFGVKIYSDVKIYFLLIKNYFISKLFLTLSVSFRQFSTAFNWMKKRETIDKYEISTVPKENKYIFHVSRFYINQTYGGITNSKRAEFIRYCKKNTNFNFDGGLVINKNLASDEILKEYHDVLTYDYIPSKQYNESIKKSIIVFSTPAAWGCHGWKIGEYFAMGKIIVSTDFHNDIPKGIIDNENILILNEKDELKNKLASVFNSENNRKKLHNSSKKYYENYLKPESVIERITTFNID